MSSRRVIVCGSQQTVKPFSNSGTSVFLQLKVNILKEPSNEAREELNNLLTDAVRLRLRADVPVAAYLSGGLDSSATTALIKEVMPETLQTFSIGFEDSEFDETPFQREVSEYLEYPAYTISPAPMKK